MFKLKWQTFLKMASLISCYKTSFKIIITNHNKLIKLQINNKYNLKYYLLHNTFLRIKVPHINFKIAIQI